MTPQLLSVSLRLSEARKFNADLTVPEGAERDKEIAGDLTTAVLEDVFEEFHICL